MANIENNEKNKARKVLRKSHESKRKILTWGFAALAAALLVVAALYVFVWRQPRQPEVPADMVIQSPIQTAQQTVAPTAAATPIATTQPLATPKPMVIQDSFAELYQDNSEIVGWISVENTIIDYPILQTNDNNYYMDKDFYKDYSYPGSIFVDFRCDFNNMYKAAHQILRS